jgi:hypothetical protein
MAKGPQATAPILDSTEPPIKRDITHTVAQIFSLQ